MRDGYRARRALAACGAALLITGIAGCGSTQSPATPSTTSAAASPATAMPRWLISANALTLLQGAGMSPTELSGDFDVPGTILIAGRNADLTGYEKALRVQDFTSDAELQTAVGDGLPPGTGGVLYDDEAWPLTPAPEQQDPAAAEARAAEAAHAHNLELIATPATDLTTVRAPGKPAYPAYLQLGISADAAKVADVIDIQAQGSETDTGKYAQFVTQAAAAARAANPHVVVLAGISTNPSGQTVTTAQVRAAVDATRSVVDGYWLNIPAAGNACPRCGTPQPQVAVDLLRGLAH